ncbi:hypothetical protein DFH09DRAFT_347734 [Mycena vulgaris]|nr:hypothetical protein DFH09DRAFT_347734 [Mycena vulgaris]
MNLTVFILTHSKARSVKPKDPQSKVIDRAGLQNRLRAWVASSHASDSLRAVRPASFILDAKGIKSLSTVHPDRLQSVAQVVSTLQETREWEHEWGGGGVFVVISDYDTELEQVSTADNIRATVQSIKVSNDPKTRENRGDQEWQPRAKKSRTEKPLEEVPINVPRRCRSSPTRTPPLRPSKVSSRAATRLPPRPRTPRVTLRRAWSGWSGACSPAWGTRSPA